MRNPFSAGMPVNREPTSNIPTPKLFGAVTVITPLAMETAVAAADGATGEALNVISRVFHHQRNGGDRMVWMTMFALVSAGSREFPITGLWLKQSRLAQ